MTQISQLPQLAGSFAFANNADWRDSIKFVDASNAAIDLTGIAFTFWMRPTSGDPNVSLQLSTAASTLTNGGTAGTLTWAAPASATKTLKPGTYAADLIAVGDGKTINLFATAPAVVIVNAGVTTP